MLYHLEPGIWLSGRALAYHSLGPEFNLQHVCTCTQPESKILTKIVRDFSVAKASNLCFRAVFIAWESFLSSLINSYSLRKLLFPGSVPHTSTSHDGVRT